MKIPYEASLKTILLSIPSNYTWLLRQTDSGTYFCNLTRKDTYIPTIYLHKSGETTVSPEPEGYSFKSIGDSPEHALKLALYQLSSYLKTESPR